MSGIIQLTFNYVAFLFLVFILTFYVGVFVRYVKTKTIVTQKMLTYRKGGLFEHYILTPSIVFVIRVLDVIFGDGLGSPFIAGHWLHTTVWTLSITLIAYVFLVFIFIFMFYLITFLYIKIFKVEDKRKVYALHSHKMVMTALIVSLVIVLSVLIPVLTTMIGSS